MAFNSPRLGSLMDPYGKVVDPSVSLPPSSNAGQAAAGVPSAPSSLRQIVAPAADASAPQEAPVAPGTPEFQQRVERNKGFLSSPEVQADLMQFALGMFSGGDFGSSLGQGLAASGRVRTNRTTESEAARKAALAERSMQVDEGQLGLNTEKLGMEKSKLKSEQDAATKRQALMAKIGGLNPDAMPEGDLLTLAGQLSLAGDNDTAKTIIDIANSKRLSTTTGDLVEYNASVKQGFKGTFDEWQKTKIKAGVPQPPPPPTASMDKSILDEGIRLSTLADTQASTIPDYEQLVQTVAQAKTGIATPYTLPMKEFFHQMGIDITPDAKNEIQILESLRAQQNKLALKLRSPASGFGLPGAASDNDIIFLKQAGPGLANAPEANMAMAIITLARARREVELTRAKATFVFQNKTLEGWDTKGGGRDKFINENSMFLPDEKEILDRISNPEKRKPGAPTTGETKNSQPVPATPPDSLSDADKALWPHMDEADKRKILDIPPAQ